jgi:competence protein ComEC
VISVGKDNSYGHPDKVPLSRLEDAEVTLYRTDELGTVIATSDGSTVTFTWERGSSGPVVPSDSRPSAPAATYIGNKKSKKLHVAGCSSLPSEDNQVLFDDYDEAIADGYTPCSKCLG